MTFRSLEQIIWKFWSFVFISNAIKNFSTSFTERQRPKDRQRAREREWEIHEPCKPIALCNVHCRMHVRLIKTRNSCSFKFNFMSQKVCISLLHLVNFHLYRDIFLELLEPSHSLSLYVYATDEVDEAKCLSITNNYEALAYICTQNASTQKQSKALCRLNAWCYSLLYIPCIYVCIT